MTAETNQLTETFTSQYLCLPESHCNQEDMCTKQATHTHLTVALGSSSIQEIWGLSLLFGDTTTPVSTWQGLLIWMVLCTPVIWPTLVISEILLNYILYLKFCLWLLCQIKKANVKLSGAGLGQGRLTGSGHNLWKVTEWDWRQNTRSAFSLYLV